jgi:alkylation response protein AidB-like acyl-CoA dehydrogenase
LVRVTPLAVPTRRPGCAGWAREVAREYALERRQFGVPIGSFQAVKHILADMYVRSALAQSATYAAAALPAGPGQHDQWRAAARAKLLAAEAALENAASAVQILGGMGFTWDMLPHYLLKRAWILEYAFGGSDDLALHLGQRLSDDMALVGQS